MKRNAHALAARQRKAGAHSEAGRPEKDVIDHINEYTDEQCAELKYRGKASMYDFCPVCLEKELTGCGVWNHIIGEVCSLDCLERYWEEGGKR